MITKEMLKDYAKKLMFDMDDNEYETLEDEFKTILKQMELIENIPNKLYRYRRFDENKKDRTIILSICLIRSEA